MLTSNHGRRLEREKDMNIIEYTFEGHENMLVWDEAGNLYIYDSGCFEEKIYWFRKMVQKDSYYTEYIFIDKEKYECLKQFEIIFPQNKNIEEPYVRRPYYRMRGKKILKEQAFDIIRRTDNFFDEIKEIRWHDDFVGNINFDNWLIHKNHYPQGYGWIHADGTVGSNAITQKYPKMMEFIYEWFGYLWAFPYLDLVVALTNWNEINPRYYEMEEDNGEDKEIDLEIKEYDEEFYDAIAMGIYVHDNKIQILDKAETVKKYKEYDSLYGKEREKFSSKYYGKNNIEQIDLAYLKKCIESYGLDADEILNKQSRYTWERD